MLLISGDCRSGVRAEAVSRSSAVEALGSRFTAANRPAALGKYRARTAECPGLVEAKVVCCQREGSISPSDWWSRWGFVISPFDSINDSIIILSIIRHCGD